ncbi:MAG: DUF4214 domain-containing protein [Clostridia bacterium]|nr:DUF4214 domain-containing protein [Clostridia bacterium]
MKRNKLTVAVLSGALAVSMIPTAIGASVITSNSDIFTNLVLRDNGNAAQGVSEFVKRCYKVALEREADEAGLEYWINKLNNGEACGAQIGFGFIFSDEYTARNRTNDEYVTDLYSMYFDRTPDQEGFNYWVGQLNGGATREFVFAGFANSEEFFNLCTRYDVIAGYYAEGIDLTQQGGVNCFVARLYKACLNRLPDQAGQSGWVMKLINKEETGASLAKNFIFSAELENRQLSNKEFVKVMYDAFFGREADPEGLAVWTEKLDGGASKNLIFKGFAESAEFENLCNSYGIERGSIDQENTQIGQGTENVLSGTDRLIDYFYDNVVKENQQLGNDIYLSSVYYYDADRMSFLSVYCSDENSVTFSYSADGMNRTEVSLTFFRDSTWVEVGISFPFYHDGVYEYFPIYYRCDINDADEILAHITEPDYKLTNDSTVRENAYYTPWLEDRLKEMPNLKADIELTYACFIKAFDKALNYWGTSKDTYGLTIGSAYANYPTTGYTSYDYRNGLISYADSGMNWIDYMKYATKFLDSACSNGDDSENYMFYGPYYYFAEDWNYVTLYNCTDGLDKKDFFFVEYWGEDKAVSEDCRIDCLIYFLSKDEVQLVFDINTDYVQTKVPGETVPSTESEICIMSCKPEELMSIISSPETLKNNSEYHFYSDGKNPISEDEAMKIFFSEIETIMNAFEYTFNYCGTSLNDAGIDF